jgi:DNA-binding transcriptional regulator YhcF (GntR family)
MKTNRPIGKSSIKFHIDKVSDNAYFEQIRDQIVNYRYFGMLKDGSRLPSIRQLAADCRINLKTAFKIYQDLEQIGLVEIRPQSGVIVGSNQVDVKQMYRSAVAKFVKKSLEEASKFNIPPEKLIELLSVYSGTGKPSQINCAVIECNMEQAGVFAWEIRERLHIRAIPVLLQETKNRKTLSLLQQVHFLVTTDFHWEEVGALGRKFNKDTFKVHVDPKFLQMILACAQAGDFVMILSDASFAPRFKRILVASVSKPVLDRIILIDYWDEKAIKKALAKARNVYISPLCFDSVIKKIPPGITIQRHEGLLSTASLEHLHTNLLFCRP